MKGLGYMIVGWNVGIAWASYFARHGHAYTRSDSVLELSLAFVVYTVLVWA